MAENPALKAFSLLQLQSWRIIDDEPVVMSSLNGLAASWRQSWNRANGYAAMNLAWHKGAQSSLSFQLSDGMNQKQVFAHSSELLAA